MSIRQYEYNHGVGNFVRQSAQVSMEPGVKPDPPPLQYRWHTCHPLRYPSNTLSPPPIPDTWRGESDYLPPDGFSHARRWHVRMLAHHWCGREADKGYLLDDSKISHYDYLATISYILGRMLKAPHHSYLDLCWGRMYLWYLLVRIIEKEELKRTYRYDSDLRCNRIEALLGQCCRVDWNLKWTGKKTHVLTSGQKVKWVIRLVPSPYKSLAFREIQESRLIYYMRLPILQLLYTKVARNKCLLNHFPRDG